MTSSQFEAIRTLLGLAVSPETSAAQMAATGLASMPEAVRLCEADAAVAATVLRAVQDAELRIRGAFVIHQPTEFLIAVGHHDHHRRPGALRLATGDIVRLTAFTTERYLRVRVDSLPANAAGYYEGIIVGHEARGSKFLPGDRVRFAEDQVADRKAMLKPCG